EMALRAGERAVSRPEIGIDLDCAPQFLEGGYHSGKRRAMEVGLRPPDRFGRVAAPGPFKRLRGRCPAYLHRQVRGELRHEIFLQRRELRERTIEPLGPEDIAAFRVDQLRGDAQVLADAPRGAFEKIAYAQVPPYPAQIPVAAAIAGGRARGD